MKKNAFLFAGQGAQYVNMGKDLYENHKIFKDIYDEAGEYLKINLLDICSDNAELSKTHNAQPAIFIMSYGIFKILEENNIKPNCAAGFSLGEITSLAVSKILSFKDALDLIKIRGEIMQEACEKTPGMMCGIIGTTDETIDEVIKEACENTGGYVIPANYNCLGQTVISGEIKSVEKAIEIFADKKIRTIKLNVSGAFHTKFMLYNQEKLIDFLKGINYNPPAFELYSNVTGEKFDFNNFDKTSMKSFMINYMPEQMSNPVRFRGELERINSDGCDLFIEIGAGKVLSGFVKRTCPNANFINIQDCSTLNAFINS